MGGLSEGDRRLDVSTRSPSETPPTVVVQREPRIDTNRHESRPCCVLKYRRLTNPHSCQLEFIRGWFLLCLSEAVGWVHGPPGIHLFQLLARLANFVEDS